MASGAAERRKIRQLEADLEDAETAKKKLERSCQKLEKELKELQEKYEALERSGKKEEWTAKKMETIMDTKSLERTISTQQEEIDRLRKELKQQKERNSNIERVERQALYTDAEATQQKRDFEAQIQQLKQEYEKQLEAKKEEIAQLKEEAEKKDRSRERRGHRVGGGGAHSTVDRSKVSFDSFTKSVANSGVESMAKELKELRQKMDAQEDSFAKEKKKLEKLISDLEFKNKELTQLKERHEKKIAKYEEDNKSLNKQLEKETKSRWELEKTKMNLDKELRDSSQIVKDSQSEVSKYRELIIQLESRTRNAEDQSRHASSDLTKLQREFEFYKKNTAEQIEKDKLKYERKISALESELNDWRLKINKSESTEGNLTLENKKLQREVEKLKAELDSQHNDFEREKKKLERQLAQVSKLSEEEIEKFKEEQRRAEERRKKEAKLLEELQLKSTAAEPAASTTSSSAAKSTETIESTLKKEIDREREKKLEAELARLKEILVLKEKQLTEELDEVKAKLKEKERAWQREKEKLLDEDKERERELQAERKKNLERDKKKTAELDLLNNELIDLRSAKKALEDQLRNLSDDLRDAENNLEDEKEEHKFDNDRNYIKLKNLQEELQQLLNDHHELNLEFKKTDNLLREAEDECRKTKRELSDLRVTLEETQANLTRAQDAMEKLKLESKQKEESLQFKLEVAQKEAIEESKEKERQIKLRRNAEQRVEELEWYFLPVEEQEKKDFSTPAMKLLKIKKQELQTELEELRKRHAKKANSLEDLHQRLVEGLRNIPDANKEAIAFQLQGLMIGLESADFPILTRMKISVALVEGLVDPEIIREMRIITEIMVDEALHFMDTPETITVLAQRDVDEDRNSPESRSKKRSESLTFRDALLNRLAKFRARRMHKPVKEVRQGILAETYTKIDG